MSSYSSAEEPVGPQLAQERHFGRYRLAYQLASGGMGTVFLARAAGPAGFEKLVALKRIHPHMASDQRFVSMFFDEARIAARIQHPNVCSVIDFGEADGNYFLTMPFIVGESMNRVLRAAAELASGPTLDMLPLMAARMVADACEGLHAAHELRDDEGRPLEVVHRDVSPHNLMVGYDGVVRVLDFGVASARHRHYQTATGEVKGKFAYLAPEQIEGQAADRRVDVWALGVVLWEAVTARRLFARDNMAATVRAVCTLSAPSVRTFRPSAPAALDEVIAKALARDISQRYPTTRAMGRDLQQLLARGERFIGAPELADWMEELLPRGRYEQERLIEGTRTNDLLAPTPAPPPPSLDQSTVQRREDRADDASPAGTPSTMVIDDSALTPMPREEPSSTPARPRRSPGRFPLVLGGIVGVAALLGATLAGLWLLRPAPEMRTIELPDEPIVSTAPSTVELTEPGAPVDGEVLELEPLAGLEPAVAPEPPPPAVPETRDEAPLAVAALGDGAEVPDPSPRTTATRPRGNGTLTVATPGGWALVFLGRRPLGEAPGVFTLPAGTHTVSIRPFGRDRSIDRRVVVPENGTARLSVPLSQ